VLAASLLGLRELWLIAAAAIGRRNGDDVRQLL
jgi:hypothetical protein